MATIAPTFTIIDGRRFNVKWAAMAPGDDGGPVKVSGAAWRSMQAIGATPTDTAAIQASNDGVNWQTATPSGVSPNSGPVEIVSRTQFLRPQVAAQAAGNLDIILHCAN